jgi:hypothetical protein
MPDQHRIVVEDGGKRLELLYLDFLSYPEVDVDNTMDFVTKWFDQINRKYREMKRYLKIVKRLQSQKRIEKDYQYLFQLRYTTDLPLDHEDLDIQRFIRNLPIGAFLHIVFRLSLNDLHGIRYCHFGDLEKLLIPVEMSSNQRHLRLVENLPEYQQFLVELPGPFLSISAKKTPSNLAPTLAPTRSHGSVSPTSSALSTTPSEQYNQVPRVDVNPEGQFQLLPQTSSTTQRPLAKRQRHSDQVEHSEAGHPRANAYSGTVIHQGMSQEVSNPITES